MKKFIAIVVVLSLAGLAFAAGKSDTGGTGDKPQELVLYSTPEWAKSIAPSLDTFTEKNGIKVNVVVVPYDQLFNQLTTSIVGGKSIDVTEVDPPWLAEMNKQGMVLKLNDKVGKDVLDQYMPASIDLMSVNRDLVALPMVAGIPYFFYNADMLRSLGYAKAPESWAQLEEISLKAIKSGAADHGIFMGLAPLEGFMVYMDVFIKLYGGDWISADKKTFTFNNEAGVAALTYMKKLIDYGVVPRASLETGDRDSLNTFLAGRAPFHFNWGFTYGIMKDASMSKVTGSIQSALVPGISKRSYTTMGGGGYAVPSTTKNQKWAVELAKWLTTGDAPKAMLASRGSDMALSSLYEDKTVFDKYPLLNTYVEQLKYAGVRPSAFLSWYSEFRDNFFLPQAHKALLGQIGIKEALNQAQAEAQKRLDKEGL
ncbi:sugar ABC transporter substrate-binding protein [Treponema sp.]